MISLWKKMHRESETNRAIAIITYFSFTCLVISSLGLAVDHRLVNAEPVWIKPIKFSLSLTTLGLTLGWYSSYINQHKLYFRRACQAAAVGTIIELTAIILQAYRGTSSHFNTTTVFDHCMFAVITLAILPVALSLVSLFVMLLREKELPPVLGLSLKWAVLLTILGMAPGVLMLMPEPVQDFITSCKRFEGHTIGFADGTSGLPFLGWSTVAGDLRAAHFLGIHALQVLPAFGVLILKLLPNTGERRQKFLVTNVGLTYSSFIFLLTMQALASESIAAPSLGTIIFACAILSMSCLSAAVAIYQPLTTMQPAAGYARVKRRHP